MAYVASGTFTTGQLIGASDLNQQIRDNEAYLLNGRQVVRQIYLKGSSTTNTSTTFADIDTTNLRLTVPATASGRVRISVALNGGTSAAAMQFRISRDSGAEFSGHATHGNAGISNTTAANLFFEDYFTGLTLASHTFDLQWRQSGASTGTLAGTVTPVTMIAEEF